MQGERLQQAEPADRRKPVAGRVFISYSAHDREVGDAVCAVLEAAGVECWIAPRDILPGASWGEAIIEGINHSRLMVVVFSGRSNESNQVVREVERAVHRGMPIVVLRIEDLNPTGALEYFLSTHHWLDAFVGDFDGHLERLATTIVRGGTGIQRHGTDVGEPPSEPQREPPSPSFEEVHPDDWTAPGRGSSRWVRRLFQDR
jgi:hypothetical protein